MILILQGQVFGQVLLESGGASMTEVVFGGPVAIGMLALSSASISATNPLLYRSNSAIARRRFKILFLYGILLQDEPLHEA
jgi:hypothetical protein